MNFYAMLLRVRRVILESFPVVLRGQVIGFLRLIFHLHGAILEDIGNNLFYLSVLLITKPQ